MMVSQIIQLSFLLVVQLVQVQATSCYNPDGSSQPNDYPCDDSSGNSACCPMGWACLGNKVCQITQFADDTAFTPFSRGSCTDQSWKSDACPNFCQRFDNTTALVEDTNDRVMVLCPLPKVNVWRCSSEFNDSNNCQTGVNLTYLSGSTNPYTVIGNFPVSEVSTINTATTSSTISSSLSQTATSSTSSSNPSSSSLTSSTGSNTALSTLQSVSTTPTSANPVTTAPLTTAPAAETTAALASNVNKSSQEDLSLGTKIGLGVGIPLGILVIGVLGLLFWRISKSAKALEAAAVNRNQRGMSPLIDDKDKFSMVSIEPVKKAYLPPPEPYELESYTPPYELNSSGRI